MMPNRAALAGALILCAMSAPMRCECDWAEERKATAFLKEFDDLMKQLIPDYNQASWNYATNITDLNQARMLAEESRYNDLAAEKAEEGSVISWDSLCSNATKKELELVLDYRYAEDEPNDTKAIRNRIASLKAQMEGIYSSAKVCMDENSHETCLALDPGITEILTKSRDENERLRAWVGWRDASGKKTRQLFAEYVQLSNELLNKTNSYYKERGEAWREPYYTGEEGEDFEEDVKSLMREAKPLFQNILAFIRRRLREIYSDYDFGDKPLIPAHLYYGRQPGRDFMPFPNHTAVDITDELNRQNYTALDMFKTSEAFFTSLNLTAMTDTFWNKSMMVKPTDGTEVVCHASAWDFGDGDDFRVKMCTNINQEDFITIHHEMGHIEYDLQYRDQPFVFQGGANPGFHEAIGDTLSLSVITTKHLKAIGLLDKNTPEDDESDINFLMAMAMDKIVYPPYFYVIDKFRWDVFKGLVTPDNYTKHWWDLRCKYQGLSPPVERTEEDFDPGAIYHVNIDYSTISYFTSYILQFQFYEALCNATNHTGPLYKCDFYNNTVAGDKLSEMLTLGSSIPWPDALEILTGSRKLDMGPVMRYFQPLMDYLEEVNEGEELDWEDHCDVFTYPTTPTPSLGSSTPTAHTTSLPEETTLPGGSPPCYVPREIAVWTIGLLLTVYVLNAFNLS